MEAEADMLLVLGACRTDAKPPSGHQMNNDGHPGPDSIVSKMRQRPVHESSKLCLMARARFGKGLLELAPRCGQSNPHCIGGGL